MLLPTNRLRGKVMVSKQTVGEALDGAGDDFVWCWELLEALRDGNSKKREASDILNFQLRLFNGLERLGRTYRSLRAEERKLVGGKARYSKKWFGIRMKALSSYRQAIREAIAVGKAVGDGYAWTFYERDRLLIDEHLSSHRQAIAPGGIGGLGERLLVENIKVMGDFMLLYHGITSFLRLGDFSLIDLKTRRVASVGELKTQKVGENEYQLSLSIIAGRKEGVPSLRVKTTEQTRKAPLRQDVDARLQRQTSAINKAIQKADDQSRSKAIGRPGEFHHEKLELLVEGSRSHRMSFHKVDRGLLLGALRSRSPRSFAARFLGSGKKIGREIDDVVPSVMEIMDKGTNENGLLIGSLGAGEAELSVGREALPIYWWDISRDVIKDLLFRNVIVATFFNPLPMWRDMRSRGFDIIYKHPSVTAAKTVDNKRIELTRFEYFYRLVTHSLMTEKCAMGMIDTMMQAAEEKGLEGYTRIEMHPRVVRHPNIGSD